MISSATNVSLQSLSAVVILLVLFSCQYFPEGKYHKEITPPDWSDVTINLASNTGDTIYLYQTTTLNLAVTIGSHAITEISARLGNSQLLTYSDRIQPIVIDVNNYPSGIYKLTIDITMASGTNNLAEIENVEKKKFSYERVVVIDREPPAKINFTVARVSDDQVELKWEAYKKFNFQKYVLTKDCYNDFYHDYLHCWTMEFPSSEATSFIDSSFVAGRARYSIRVVAANKESGSDLAGIEEWYEANLKTRWLDSEKAELSWNKPKVAYNVAGYEIAFSNYDDSRSFYIQGADDTVLQIDGQLNFPAAKQVHLKVKPKGYNDYGYGDAHGFGTLQAGKSFVGFTGTSLSFKPAFNKYFAIGYANNTLSVIQINPDTYAIEQSHPSAEGLYATSEDGTYLYVVNNKKLIRLNATDFSEISTHDFSVFDPEHVTMKVSNNNVLIISNQVWDLNSFTLKQTLPAGLLDISPDGQFIVGWEKLFHYNGTSFEETATAGTFGTGEFTSDQKFVSYSSSIQVFDLVSMSVVKTFTRDPNAGHLRFDAATGLVGGWSDEFVQGAKFFFAYSITTGELVKKIDIANVSSQYSDLLLVNNNLVCSCGVMVSIDWYK
jgi:hypothetical protein